MLSQPDLLPEARLSWLVALLPYLEHKEVYNRMDRRAAWNGETNQEAVRTAIELFLCPGNPQLPAVNDPALTHYVGVTGLGADAATLSVKDPRAGFFGYERTVTCSDIKDGTSQTLAVIEIARANGPWAAGGPVTVRGLDPSQQPYMGVNGPFGTKHREDRFFRTNPLVANVLLVDGSVRPFLESNNPRTLESLATIAGGDKVGDDF
jgi:hypothetical protein